MNRGEAGAQAGTGGRLGFRQVLAYGLGDVANNFAFSMGMLFLLGYYTDIAGIDAAAAGTLLLLVRIYDAVVDLAVGRWLDQRPATPGRSRFRPLLLWGAVPLLLNLAVFSVPSGWSHDAKLIYAYLSYALLGTAYAFVNIAYGSLASVMTQEPRDRARLGAIRSFMATVTTIFLAALIGSLMRHPDADLQTTLTGITGVLAAVGTGLYFVSYAATREVVPRGTRIPGWRESLQTVRRNRPLRLLCLTAILSLAGASAIGTTAIFYARYVLGNAAHFLPLVLSSSVLGTLVSVPLAPRLTARLGKKRVFLVGMAVATLAHAGLYGFAPATLPGSAAFLALGSIGVGLAMISLWAMEADTVEYGEWQTGLRLEGTNYALFSLMRKLGLAAGGAIPAFLLAHAGYLPNVATPHPAVIETIRAGISLVPALSFLCAFLVMSVYPLSDRRFKEMLAQRRS